MRIIGPESDVWEPDHPEPLIPSVRCTRTHDLYHSATWAAFLALIGAAMALGLAEGHAGTCHTRGIHHLAGEGHLGTLTVEGQVKEGEFGGLGEY